jgi:hypothetical protein
MTSLLYTDADTVFVCPVMDRRGGDTDGGDHAVAASRIGAATLIIPSSISEREIRYPEARASAMAWQRADACKAGRGLPRQRLPYRIRQASPKEKKR